MTDSSSAGGDARPRMEIVEVEHYVHLTVHVHDGPILPRSYSRSGATWQPQRIDIAYVRGGDEDDWRAHRVDVRGPELRKGGSAGSRRERVNYAGYRANETPNWIAEFVEQHMPQDGAR